MPQQIYVCMQYNEADPKTFIQEYKYTQWSSIGVIIRSKNVLQIIEQTNFYFSIFDSCIYEIWAGRFFNQCNNTSIF